MQFAIDNVDCIDSSVDLQKKHTFGAENTNDFDRKDGKKVILSKDGVCKSLKYMAQELDTFLIIQSQTTKLQDGAGDLPIGKQAAYGTSRLDWFSDFVLGLWRPLNRVSENCRQENLFITAFQYVKKREEDALRDKLGLQEKVVVKYIPHTEDFVELKGNDFDIFHDLNKKANAKREVDGKQQTGSYRPATF